MQPSSAAEWRENGLVVAGGFAGTALSAMHVYSIGIMIAPLEKEFGWARAEITSGLLVISIFSVLFSPFMGIAIDRFGPRRIALLGCCLFCLAMSLLSQASPNILSWWLLWGLLGVAHLHLKPTVWLAGVSSLFLASRGKAIAVTLSGTGLASFSVPFITYLLITRYGWRTAYISLAALGALVTIPLVYFFFSSARDKNRSRARKVPAFADALTGVSLQQGLRSPAFYKMAVAALAMSIAMPALTVNLVPILAGTGMKGAIAAALAGMIGVAMVIGRLAGGYLLDKFNAQVVAACMVLLPMIASLLLLTTDTLPPLTIAVFIIGFASGAETDAISYLVARHFGIKSFGGLFGTIVGLITLGVGVGPVLANYIYDNIRSYTPVLWAIMPISVLAAILFLSIGPPPKAGSAAPDG